MSTFELFPYYITIYIAKLTSSIWQVHHFREDNTTTTFVLSTITIIIIWLHIIHIKFLFSQFILNSS